jgi:hypothetical protein
MTPRCPAAPNQTSPSGPILYFVITCPYCATARTEQMPIDACQIVYECTGCGVTLRPKSGDCCVFALMVPFLARRSKPRAPDSSEGNAFFFALKTL